MKIATMHPANASCSWRLNQCEIAIDVENEFLQVGPFRLTRVEAIALAAVIKLGAAQLPRTSK
jgi:hypothetical protein